MSQHAVVPTAAPIAKLLLVKPLDLYMIMITNCWLPWLDEHGLIYIAMLAGIQGNHDDHTWAHMASVSSDALLSASC